MATATALETRVAHAVGIVQRRRFGGASPDRAATVRTDLASAVFGELGTLDTDALALVSGDASALIALTERAGHALRYAESVRHTAPAAYRSDEMRLTAATLEKLTLVEKRALVSVLTNVDGNAATVEKIDAVLAAIVSAGVWDRLALRPRHEASHVGHLLPLVSDASQASLTDSAYADALRDAADVESLRGDMGRAVRKLADAVPAWTECEQQSRDVLTHWSPVRRARAAERLTRYRDRCYRRGLRAWRSGDRSTAYRAVAYLATFSAHSHAEPGNAATVQHAADSHAARPERVVEHRDGTRTYIAPAVAWSAVCDAAGLPTDETTARRLSRDVRQWRELVIGRARATVRELESLAPAVSGPPVPTTERVRYAFASLAQSAASAHAAAVERNAARWYADGLTAWHRGDKRTAWNVVAMLASADTVPTLVAETGRDACASPSPVARVPRTGSMVRNASGTVRRVRGGASPFHY